MFFSFPHISIDAKVRLRLQVLVGALPWRGAAALDDCCDQREGCCSLIQTHIHSRRAGQGGADLAPRPLPCLLCLRRPEQGKAEQAVLALAVCCSPLLRPCSPAGPTGGLAWPGSSAHPPALHRHPPTPHSHCRLWWTSSRRGSPATASSREVGGVGRAAAWHVGPLTRCRCLACGMQQPHSSLAPKPCPIDRRPAPCACAVHQPLDIEFSILKQRLARRLRFEGHDDHSVGGLDLVALTKASRRRLRRAAWAILNLLLPAAGAASCPLAALWCTCFLQPPLRVLG